MNLGLIFPNQLFKSHPLFKHALDKVLLIEDSLFFGDYHYPLKFSKHKLLYHRVCMRKYEKQLIALGYDVRYVPYQKNKNLLKLELNKFKRDSNLKVFTLDPVDYVLEKRIKSNCDRLGYDLEILECPGFVNTQAINDQWIATHKNLRMSEFYKYQRSRLQILMKDGIPQGGKWSFDADNRKKVPKKEIPLIPALPEVPSDQITEDATKSINKEFRSNIGSLGSVRYPSTHKEALRWLRNFLKTRLIKFGDYEDAILENQTWLYHSVLTPMLNVGLITPGEVVDETVRYAKKNSIPLNSLEGFVRQIIGWREFMRMTYQHYGSQMRNSNHWGHNRSLPNAFYTATTHVDPVDCAIHRILKTGYCHHIERLMVLGGFMFLCEIHPDEIYKWFMEMFVDSYDWVMVPNVYSMSQHADGGLITTKPYFSGSNYVLKMSNFKRGEWCQIWDGLFWRWIEKNKSDLKKNPRWAIMCKRANDMDVKKMNTHIRIADKYLDNLQ